MNQYYTLKPWHRQEFPLASIDSLLSYKNKSEGIEGSSFPFAYNSEGEKLSTLMVAFGDVFC